MSKREVRVFLNDMLGAIQKIERYTEGKSSKEFLSDDLLLDAVFRNLEVIGEASKNIPMNFRKKYPEVEWRKVAGLRDILIHQYFGIDYDILSDIVKNKIPKLKEQIERILSET
jgi:uncharacterized protein with HEPN domain